MFILSVRAAAKFEVSNTKTSSEMDRQWSAFVSPFREYFMRTLFSEYPISGGNWIVNLIGDSLRMAKRDIYLTGAGPVALRKQKFEFNPACHSEEILVSGRHLASSDLKLSFGRNGIRLKDTATREPGPFVVALPLTDQIVNKLNRLGIQCNKNFRPIKNGAVRPLSCIIDSIAVGTQKSR